MWHISVSGKYTLFYIIITVFWVLFNKVFVILQNAKHLLVFNVKQTYGISLEMEQCLESDFDYEIVYKNTRNEHQYKLVSNVHTMQGTSHMSVVSQHKVTLAGLLKAKEMEISTALWACGVLTKIV